MSLLEIKPADSFDVADEWNQLKLYVDPGAPLPLAQNEFLVLHGEFRDRLQGIDGNCERFERRRGPFAKRVVRSDQVCRYLGLFHSDRNDLTTLHRSRSSHWVIGIERERAVASTQVGRSHAGQSVALGLDR